MGLKELANLAQGSKELRHHNSAENMVLKVPIIRKQIGLGPETNRFIKSIILEHGDEQQRRTNVKAIMTEWFMHKKHSVFNELCTQAIEFADENSPHKVPLEPFDCWGNISYKGDWVKVHDHWPFVWSWCYYAQVSKACSPIFYPHTNNTQMTETQNKFRVMILEDPNIPDKYLCIQEGLTKDDAFELLAMLQDQGKTDLEIEEYYPDENRLGRNAELH